MREVNTLDSMTVEVLRHPTNDDWLRCYNLALNTVGKTSHRLPLEEWKVGILGAGHSPIRTLWFTIRMNIPYWVSVHFVRHKFGCEHYVRSQRNDKQDEYDRETAPQSMMVSHIMEVNAQELIHMANMRLCNKADPMTNAVMAMICEEVVKTNPEFDALLVPKCVAMGGCNEMDGCGWYDRV